MNTNLLHTHRLSVSAPALAEPEVSESFSVLRQIEQMIAAELEQGDNSQFPEAAEVSSKTEPPAPPPKRRRLKDLPAPFSDPFIAVHCGERRIEAHLNAECLIEADEIRSAYFSKANKLAQDYRKENELRTGRRKVRLPATVIEAAYHAGMPLSSLRTALDVDAPHLMLALRRAGFDTVASGNDRLLTPSRRRLLEPGHAPLIQFPQPEEITMNTRAAIAGAEKDNRMTNAQKEAELRETIAAYIAAHGKPPSIQHLQKTLGLSHGFVRRRWPADLPLPTTVQRYKQGAAKTEATLPSSAGEPVDAERNVSEAASQLSVATSLAELAPVICELNYGDHLVEGFFQGAHGQPMCDEVKPCGEGLVMLVKYWRTKLPEVESILRLASELAPAA